jgi:hypothetical protein
VYYTPLLKEVSEMSRGTPVRTFRADDQFWDRLVKEIERLNINRFDQPRSVSQFILEAVNEVMSKPERRKRSRERAKQVSRMDQDFRDAYIELSGKGKCDEWGSVESERVAAEWIAAGRPAPEKEFIIEHANLLPIDCWECEECRKKDGRKMFGAVYFCPDGSEVGMCWNCLEVNGKLPTGW